MKDIIVERLNKMEDLEQRKMLKNIISGFLLNLVDYQETSNKNLETRIFDEIEDIERKYDVFVTVCPKEEVDPIDQFLFPVLREDVEEKKFDMKEIAEKLNRDEEIRLFPIFMKCSYPEIRKLIMSEKEYSGEITTDSNRYSIKIKLKHNRRYLDEIENLYNIFIKNGIPWKTVNNPYANKFFDVVLTKCDNTLKEDEEIQEIKFNLEEYENYKVSDMVLLWNIEILSMKSDGFPMPAIDRINYEHVISLNKTGPDNGYLVKDNENLVRYIKRNKDELVIVSPKEKAGNWCILKVTQPVEEKVRKFKYELISNCRKNSFINKFAQKQASIIRTKGEIMRIVNSFEASGRFKPESIQFGEFKNSSCITYDLNSFIVDDIRVGNDRKIMKLRFTSEEKDYFLIYDLLSFLVSEIQMYFPEFECKGELI